MRPLLSSAIVMCAMTSPVFAQETLTGKDLAALAEKVRTFTPRDQFDLQPAQPSLAGKRFSYTIEPRPIGRATNCDGYPEWVYLQAQRRLNFFWGASLALTYDLKGKNGPVFPPSMSKPRNAELMFRSFTCEKSVQPTYTAFNAFGAHFTIEKTTDTVTAIADFDPLSRRMAASSWEATVTGDAARALSANARIRVSGTLSDWWQGISVVCGQKRLEPSIRLPLDRTTNLCMIRGQVEKVEVIDQRSGATLFAMVADSARR
jgi:hypothetical protein